MSVGLLYCIYKIRRGVKDVLSWTAPVCLQWIIFDCTQVYLLWVRAVILKCFLSIDYQNLCVNKRKQLKCVVSFSHAATLLFQKSVAPAKMLSINPLSRWQTYINTCCKLYCIAALWCVEVDELCCAVKGAKPAPICFHHGFTQDAASCTCQNAQLSSCFMMLM